METCGWYLDCPLKKPPSNEIALRDFLEPSLKSIEPARLGGAAKDILKKPKYPKPKEPKWKAIIVDASDEDISIMEAPALYSANVISSPVQPLAKRLREDPIATTPIVKLAAMVGFITPPKRKKHVSNHRASVKVHIIHR